jgi:hypothetical protein
MSFPHSLIRYAELPAFFRAVGSDSLTENQQALPVFWKCLLLLVGRQGLEPWTR